MIFSAITWETVLSASKASFIAPVFASYTFPGTALRTMAIISFWPDGESFRPELFDPMAFCIPLWAECIGAIAEWGI
jgi:hypothetical protein